MTDRLLYTLALPDAAQTGGGSNVQRRLASLGALSDDLGDVSSITSDPGTERLEGQLRGAVADKKAGELSELVDQAAAIETLPYTALSTTTDEDGYYTPSNIEVGRVDPRVDSVWEFRGSLTREGSRESHFRELNLAPTSVTNPFGSTDPVVYAPNTATRQRWFDPDTQTTVDATVQAGYDTENGGVEEFDATEPSFSGNDEYALVYDTPLDSEWSTDPRLWDDYGRSKTITGSAGQSTIGWQRVYATDHEYRGDRVLDNGRLRLTFDLSQPVIEAEQWAPGSQSWSSVPLGSSLWRIQEVDIRHIGQARIDGWFRFENDSTNSVDELVGSFKRGYGGVLWTQVGSSTASGLQTRLDPIASTIDTDMESRMTIRKREVVDG